MKLAFAGTPQIAVPILESLSKHFEIAAVFTQPARPRGRGLVVEASPVASFAQSRGIPVSSDLDPEALSAVDLLVTMAYGVIVPREIFEAPRLGAINLHASLLPAWRGAAPVQRAIEAGDTRGGMTIFKIEEGLDTGPIITSHELSIEPDETGLQFLERLVTYTASFLPNVIAQYADGILRPVAQDHARASHARKIRKEEGRLSWENDVETFYRKFRAFSPWPGISVNDLKLLSIRPAHVTGAPGAVLTVDPLIVAVGGGGLLLERVQQSGGRPISGADYARGKRLSIGDVL